MTLEAKVGAFTLAGILLIVGSVIGLSGFSLSTDNGYTVYVGFHQVLGITEQSDVRLSGVPVGKVKSVTNDGIGVTVTLGITPGVDIPTASTVTVGSTGVMGEKFINILPREVTGQWVKDGDYLIGTDEEGMDVVFDKMSKALTDVRVLLGNINDMVGDPKLKEAVVVTAQNMEGASEHINELTAVLEEMAKENHGDINGIIGNMNGITAALDRTMANVEHMMQNADTVFGDPKTAENIKATLQNVKDTSDKISHMASNMDKTFGDPKTAEDLQKTIANARSLSDRADKMLGKVASIKVQPEVDVMYSGKKDDYKANLNVDVGADKGMFVSVGADDIGDKDKLNAQVGTRSGNFALRGGVIKGEGGVGADAYAGKNLKLSADVYDFDDAALRLRAEYALNKNSGTYLLGEFDDVTDSDKRTAYLGLRQKF